MLQKIIRPIVMSVIIFVVLFVVGFIFSSLTGITLFIVPSNETVEISSIINIVFTFIGILIASGIFESSPLQNQMLKMFSDEADVVIEIDKNMFFVPIYTFKLNGTQFNKEKAKVMNVSTVFHFDFIIYNRTLAEATIKEIKLILGRDSDRAYIADSFAERSLGGGCSEGPKFKQFMVLKGQRDSRLITFKPEIIDKKWLVNDYTVNMSEIKFIVKYTTNGKSCTLTKSVQINLSQKDIDYLKSMTQPELIDKLVGPDEAQFKRDALRLTDYYSVQGLNEQFIVKDI